jgi:hypothetical protein
MTICGGCGHSMHWHECGATGNGRRSPSYRDSGMNIDDFGVRPTHEHRFDLQLGPDGLGRIYGEYEGYVRQCKCGEYAPDFEEWKARRVAYLNQRAVVIAREVEGFDESHD